MFGERAVPRRLQHEGTGIYSHGQRFCCLVINRQEVGYSVCPHLQRQAILVCTNSIVEEDQEVSVNSARMYSKDALYNTLALAPVKL